MGEGLGFLARRFSAPIELSQCDGHTSSEAVYVLRCAILHGDEDTQMDPNPPTQPPSAPTRPNPGRTSLRRPTPSPIHRSHRPTHRNRRRTRHSPTHCSTTRHLSRINRPRSSDRASRSCNRARTKAPEPRQALTAS